MKHTPGRATSLEASPMVQRIRYVGLDVSKERSAVALAEADGSLTEYGNIVTMRARSRVWWRRDMRG